MFSYSRTEDGVVSGMQEVVPRTGSAHRIGLFNPASTVGQISRLRLVNRGTDAVAVTIEGVDDAGRSPGGAVRLTLPARGSRMVTAEELESGEAEGLTGALGDGTGRWRLVVTADGAIEVMHLLASTASGEQHEWGIEYEWDHDRVRAFMDGIDFSDAHYGARTWVVVLTYLLTDHRYLML